MSAPGCIAAVFFRGADDRCGSEGDADGSGCQRPQRVDSALSSKLPSDTNAVFKYLGNDAISVCTSSHRWRRGGSAAQRSRWLPEATVCGETATRLDDRCLVRRRSSHNPTRDKVCQCDVLTHERAPLQAPAGIEPEHLVDETSDRVGVRSRISTVAPTMRTRCPAKLARGWCSGSSSIRENFALASRNKVSSGPRRKVRGK